jgi:negative regulator of genetic competence, sporulation and motility
MNEKGVKIDDLMDNRSKAEEFLRGILQEAREKLDFQTSGEALNVQLSIMKDGDVLLMISDDQNAVIRTMLDQLKDAFTHEDAQTIRIREHKKKSNPTQMLCTWIDRGYIIRDEDGVYHKTPTYLKRKKVA